MSFNDFDIILQIFSADDRENNFKFSHSSPPRQ